jgi:hypothetical protein
MKTRTWIILLCLHLFALAAVAQNPAKRQVVLQVSNGGFVAFRSETSAPANQAVPDSKSFAALLYSQAFAGQDRIIHRVLTDAQQNVVFGYDLWISADPVTKKFSVAVLPANDAFRRSFLRPNGSFATFPKSTTPQTLDDGDAVSLELLVNHESGVKIVDVVSVTFDRAKLRDGSPETAPKDFTLAVKNYSLSIDGNIVSRNKSKIGASGALLWFYVPERGRFIFSLVPRDGYQFEKIAVLDENKIAFTANGERYEWSSETPILPNGGTWNLWVLHDPHYTPLFGSEILVPKTARKSTNMFEKLGDVLANQGVTFSINGSSKRDPNTPDVPQKVMVGGADSMEHLLPKSP